MSYAIYSGYSINPVPIKYANLHSEEFFEIWLQNTKKYSDPNSKIKVCGPDIIKSIKDDRLSFITSYPNLGHGDDYRTGKRNGKWCGWTAGVIYGMVDAYVNGVDFVYKEQDCLWFGDCIEQLYSEIGDSDIIYGSSRIMDVGQSLFLVKRDSIYKIISVLCQDDGIQYPEFKFREIKNGKRMSFGYDRDRPFNPNGFPFYIQQISVGDLNILKSNNLI